MVKGIAVNLKSYEETVQRLLKVIKLDVELKKHDKILIKPNLISGNSEISTKTEFAEQVLKFCMENKAPGTEVFIAEGCDGKETIDVFDELGYSKLAEKYGIGLIDLNYTETEEISRNDFLKFEKIIYPKILLDSFVISTPQLNESEEIGITASLDNMLGAYPAKNYQGFFSRTKNKLSKFHPKYQIHDILKCKVPELAVIDASIKGVILAGQPLEMDKQSARALKIDWKSIPHLKLIDESFSDDNQSKGRKEIKE